MHLRSISDVGAKPFVAFSAHKDQEGSVTSNGNGSTDAQANFRQGSICSEKGEQRKAITYLDDAIRLNPRFADAYCLRGINYFDLGEYKRAEADFSQAIKFKPHGMTYYMRGRAYFEQRNYPKAIADLSQAIDRKHEVPDSQLTEAHFLRGFSWAEAGNYKQAIPDFSQAIALNYPNRAAAFRCRGWSHYSRKNYAQAMADATQAITLNPQNADGYYLRGLCWINKAGGDRNAIADLSAAIVHKPQWAQAYFVRARVYLLTGQVTEANRDLAMHKKLRNEGKSN